MKRGVLIVGGGPTGMTLGLQLQRYGVPFRIIEKRRPEASPSKALSINTASLHLLADFGITDELVTQGRRIEVVTLHYQNCRMRRIRFKTLGSPYPYFLMLPQPDTEAALERRLVQGGHEVERDCELLHLEQDAAEVRVTIRAGSALKHQQYDYVAGCDGGLSKVRHELGFSFTGHDYAMYFLLADVKIKWSGRHTEGHYFVQDDGFMILLPLKNGFHRVVLKAAGLCPPGYKPSLAEIQTEVARYNVGDLQVADPIWLSSAPFYNRSAPAFSQGRVFLAGDAAHMFSPIGGFGMNTGIGDGFNLGWKLGFVHHGMGTDTLLESYDKERHANTKKLLTKTDLSTSLIARLNRHQRTDEARFAPKMVNRDAMRMAPWDAAGLTVSYGQNDAIARPHHTLQMGRVLPYVHCVPHAPADGSRQNSLHLIGKRTYRLIVAAHGGSAQALAAARLTQHLKEASQGLILPLFLLSSAPEHPLAAEDYVIDTNHVLAKAWCLNAGDFALVRPDFYVACVGNLSSPAALYAWLAKWHGIDANKDVRHAA
jgi:2-polyprenyl-6-methoxyphenol hydroxylase-like FAD-dependent oxidoreductase